MKKNNNISIGSLITSTIFGALLGWYVGGIIPYLEGMRFIWVAIGISLLVAMGYKYPILVESFAYGFSILVLFQAFWDWGARDWTEWRTIMTLGAIGLLILNITTGKLKLIGAKRVFKNQLGVTR